MRRYISGTCLPAQKTYPVGTQLTEKAREIAVRLGKPDFKGTNGWLEKWKKRYNI